MNAQDKLVELATFSSNLQSRRHLVGNIADLYQRSPVGSKAWQAFCASWNELDLDEYMADGGTYRSRRYSEFRVLPTERTVELLPHVPFRQAKVINYLNGDVDRLYRPLATETVDNAAFRQVLVGCTMLLEALHPGAAWKAQVFQNRIWARPSEPGNPTPEGVHRDGVEYVLTMLTTRLAIEGGESSTYTEDGKTVLSSKTLADSGDFILLDDVHTKHDVTPIRPLVEGSEGYRDVLVAMFSQE